MTASHRTAVELAHSLGKLRLIDGVAARGRDGSLWLIHRKSWNADEFDNLARMLLHLSDVDSVPSLARRFDAFAEPVIPDRLVVVRAALRRLKDGSRAQALAQRGLKPLRSSRDRDLRERLAVARHRCAALQQWLGGGEFDSRAVSLVPFEAPRYAPQTRLPQEQLRRFRLAADAVAALYGVAAGARAWRELSTVWPLLDADVREDQLQARLAAVLAAPDVDVALPPEASMDWLTSAAHAVCDLTPDQAAKVWHLACANPTERCPSGWKLAEQPEIVEILAKHDWPHVPNAALTDGPTVTRFLAIRSYLQRHWELDDEDEEDLALVLAKARPGTHDHLAVARMVRAALGRGVSRPTVTAGLRLGGPHATSVASYLARWDEIAPTQRPDNFTAVATGLDLDHSALDRYLLYRQLSGHGATFSTTVTKPLQFPADQRARRWKRARNAVGRSLERFATSGVREALDDRVRATARLIFGKRVAADQGLVDIVSGLDRAPDLPGSTLALFTRHMTDPAPLTELEANSRWLTGVEGSMDVTRWLAGFTTTVEVDGRRFRVATARTAQDYAHMGSHFGTCLSLHTGSYRSSVPINALDANKHLVMVHEVVDGKRAWVARKIVGITRGTALVGFKLYEVKDLPAGLETAVNTAVGTFAGALGLPLVNSGRIQPLHAGDWLNDGVVAWQPCAAEQPGDMSALRAAVDASDTGALRAVAANADNAVVQGAAVFHVLRLDRGATLPTVWAGHMVIEALSAIGRFGTARRLAMQECSAACAADSILAGLEDRPDVVAKALRELRRLPSLGRGGEVAARLWLQTLSVDVLAQLFEAATHSAPSLLEAKAATWKWSHIIGRAATRDDTWRVLSRKRLLTPTARRALKQAGCRPGGEFAGVKFAAEHRQPSVVVAMLWGCDTLVDQLLPKAQTRRNDATLADMRERLEAFALPGQTRPWP